MLNGGVHSATDNREVVLGWIARYAPSMNLGIATGDHCVVIDVDPRNGGAENLESLETDLGNLPRAWLAHTGGGGLHIYIDAISASVRTSHGKLGTGIDVQAEGGYVVAPPSRHASGGRYTWHEEGPFRTRQIPPLSDAWIARLATPTTRPSGDREVETIHEGARNTTLTSIGGQLRSAGLSRDALFAALLAENAARCEPPLEEKEVERIAESVSRYATRADESAEEDKAEIVMRAVLDRHFAGGGHIIHAADGQFWAYDGKKWEVMPRQVLQSIALKTMRTLDLGPSNRASLMKQAAALLASEVAIADDRLRFLQPPPPVINCRNGELWIAPDGTVELRPHRAESYLRHVLDAEYDPDATCTRYDEAVAEIFSGNKRMVRHWHELLGYVIQPDRKIPLVVICEGAGGNGKTRWSRRLSGSWDRSSSA